jgi:CDP-paratose 2-epimerase
MSRFLVTGGLGVIGSSFARAVLGEPGSRVTIVDAAEEPRNDWMAAELLERWPSRVTIIKTRLEKCVGDLRLQDFDGVLHAAAFTGIPQSALDPADDWTCNVVATQLLLERMRLDKQQGLRVPPTVVLSSVKPYRTPGFDRVVQKHDRYVLGFDPEGWHGIDEGCPMEPDEPYAASKLAQSALCMAYGRSYDLPVVTFRCSNLYGAAPCHGPRHGWLTWFCIAATMGWPIEVQGTGLQVRDMLYADDVTSAVRKALAMAESLCGEVFNLGGGADRMLSVREAVEWLRERCGAVETRSAPGRKREDPLFLTDTTKWRALSGWKPVVYPAEGMNQICQWAQSERQRLQRVYEGLV